MLIMSYTKFHKGLYTLYSSKSFLKTNSPKQKYISPEDAEKIIF